MPPMSICQTLVPIILKREIEFNARLILVISAIGFLLSFFIARTTQTSTDIRKLLADISVFMMFYAFTLWHKKYQQLFGLIIYSLLFNIDLLESGFFVCDNPVAKVLKDYST